MLMDWLRRFHYHYIYAPKRMKTVQELRKARRFLRDQKRYEDQIREVWRTNPEKKPWSDDFLFYERARRMIKKDRAFVKFYFNYNKRKKDDGELINEACRRVRSGSTNKNRLVSDAIQRMRRKNCSCDDIWNDN